VTTPHYAHLPVARDALQQGLHVLVDKPLCAHKADAMELLAAHTNSDQVFGIMFNQRTSRTYQRVRDLVQSGILGEIIRITWIVTDWFRTDVYYKSSWRGTWAGEGGGVLLNQAPHQLDLMQWIRGMPTRVYGICRLGKHNPIEVEDDVTALLEYPNGGTGVFITCTGESPGTNRLEISGNKGKITVEPNGICQWEENEVPASIYRKTATDGFAKPPTKIHPLPGPESCDQKEIMIRNFTEAILDGVPLIAPAEEGLRSLELANAILYSSLTDQPVDLPLSADIYASRLQALRDDSSSMPR
jgi:predicted dehydrogenase